MSSSLDIGTDNILPPMNPRIRAQIAQMGKMERIRRYGSLNYKPPDPNATKANEPKLTRSVTTTSAFRLAKFDRENWHRYFKRDTAPRSRGPNPKLTVAIPAQSFQPAVNSHTPLSPTPPARAPSPSYITPSRPADPVSPLYSPLPSDIPSRVDSPVRSISMRTPAKQPMDRAPRQLLQVPAAPARSRSASPMRSALLPPTPLSPPTPALSSASSSAFSTPLSSPAPLTRRPSFRSESPEEVALKQNRRSGRLFQEPVVPLLDALDGKAPFDIINEDIEDMLENYYQHVTSPPNKYGFVEQDDFFGARLSRQFAF
ncbi:hypothetical protein CYLTODRAFT_420353 [Cylindrobasidium torrendii FP15055 ss-10]|uniref:Uncharacterized protein n=1 Tax=Cylindrobasidium torrendii FP15055 ss-10 TaxID=1314674 RepID=A0A0D7BGT7_9AGAR|nr:hypothetical protein CYLTODRAFT_420353 [Cylindrobasidium torrendii FP15055 ss-10]